jgi:secreted protein with Ig-like and vWFA domain
MNNDIPFTTIGDEPVEARIVAWVLGEASAFEAAELERLCDERPELMIFKRRMFALHGLLAEAENPQADDAWKLRLDKRKPVEEIYGEETQLRLEVVKEKRIGRSGRRAFLAIAACLMLTVIVAGLLAPGGIQKSRKKSDVAEARSNELQRQLALASNTPARTQRLETSLPPELIEGTPRPMNVPNLEAPASGPAGSATWRSSGPVGKDAFMAETSSSNFILPEPTDSFAEMKGVSDEGQKAAQERLGGASALRDARARVVPAEPARPSSFMAKAGAGTVTSGTSVPVPQSASSLALGDSSGIGSGLGSGGGFGGGVPAETKPQSSTIAGNRSGDGIVDKKSIDGILNDPGRIEGEGASLAGEVAQQEDKARDGGDMPGLGRLFSNDEKGNLSGESFSAQNDELAGANTYSGGTTVVGGALAAGRSGGLSGNVPAPAAAPMPEQSAPTDANGPVDAVVGQPRPARPVATEEVRYKIDNAYKQPAPGASDADYWDTSEALAKGKKSGTEYEIHTGYESEYLFRGVDLGKDQDDGADKEKEEQDLRLPRITTRSALAPDKAIKAAEELRNTGKTDEAKKMLDDTLSENPASKEVRDEIAKLDDPIRTNAALTHDRTRSHLLSEAEKSWETEVSEKQAKVDVLRELEYPTEYEPPALPNAGAQAAAFPVTPASPASWARRDKGIEAMGTDALAKAIRDQEYKVEERRKALSTIVRTKGIIYKRSDESEDEAREEAIKRGLDAQDYVDARREFEKEQELLQQMKLKLMGASIKPTPEPPKPDLAKLMEEISTSEEPYSTFSLNISDASFRIAQAAMDKGERPDPAGVKVEQFYNAVDYGDPAPAAGEPVSCAIEQAAHPVIPGRNLVRVALKTAAAGRSASQPLHLTLLVDQSGSMTRADRRAAMDAAMAGLGKLLTEKDIVNIVGFSRNSRLVADGMKGDVAGKKLAELVNQSASEGGTNLETAIELAGQMAKRRMPDGAQNRIVLLTDGAANLGDADPQRLAAKVEQLRQQGVAFDIAGIAADGLNDELLGELARKGNGRYYVVGKGAEEDFAKQLAGAFRPAAENVKVQLRFNPERVARYKLIGFEKDRLKTEDFRNDKVDAAELAAEEAGVAIYQIEPNPNGSGEIGEVSVRFRDTASGEMVERGWTIPHDASAPAIDRATPSMQLATLAMFAAEKLKGGPLGEAIDFKQLAEAQASVKQFYGGNARAGEMLRMVDMLK